jgi:hypothetical protein
VLYSFDTSRSALAKSTAALVSQVQNATSSCKFCHFNCILPFQMRHCQMCLQHCQFKSSRRFKSSIARTPAALSFQLRSCHFKCSRVATQLLRKRFNSPVSIKVKPCAALPVQEQQTDRFLHFLQDLSPLSAADAAFICDNAPAHRGAADAELRETQMLQKLPPYSPMLNIVENAISVYKAAMKRVLEEARPHLLLMTHEERMAQLAGMAEAHTEDIQPHMAPGWFRRLQSFVPAACIRMEDILMQLN